MNISVVSFTQKGYLLSCKVAEKLEGLNNAYKIEIYTKCSQIGSSDIDKSISLKYGYTYIDSKIDRWAAEQMQNKSTLIFIGACGIAVRAIASSVKNKLYDSPVIVIDELGKYVIPILSGHMGGANELSNLISKQINAVSVITTATDINEKFSVDVFAKENNLAILNKDGIAKVSAKVLSDKIITVSADSFFREWLTLENFEFVKYPPDRPVDILISRDNDIEKYDAKLYLKPKQFILGIGCKKNTTCENIELAISESLKETKIDRNEIRMIASVDLKKHEPGILKWCNQNRIDFVTYTAEELLSLEGEFTASAFVKEMVGVDNVCERAAVLGCKRELQKMINRYEQFEKENMLCNKSTASSINLLYKKHIYNGVTVAIARYNYNKGKIDLH